MENGRTRIFENYLIDRAGIIYTSGGEIIKKYIRSRGYHHIWLIVDGKRKEFSVHRLVAKTFIPNMHKKPCVNHINAIKTDNRVENLEWVTNLENARHARLMGLFPKKHTPNRANATKHPSISAYTNLNCRCSECKALISEYYRNLNRRKKQNY